MRGPNICDPVAHGFVNGILERLGATLGGHDLCPHHLHAENIQGLSLNVNGAHVDDALQVHQCACRCSGNAMLTSSGLCNNSFLSESLCQESLAQGIVDLVSASVSQLLTLEPKLSTTKLFGHSFCVIEWRGATNEFGPQALDLCYENRVFLGRLPSNRKFFVCRHQGLWDVAATVCAKVP